MNFDEQALRKKKNELIALAERAVERHAVGQPFI
jgi:hypothetical protein